MSYTRRDLLCAPDGPLAIHRFDRMCGLALSGNRSVVGASRYVMTILVIVKVVKGVNVSSTVNNGRLYKVRERKRKEALAFIWGS